MTQGLPEGTVTILFTDVVGSTELTNRLGDEAARDVLGACDELVRRQVERHRGREVKGMGDGLMVAFTSARRAIACAVDIQRAMAKRARDEPDRAVGVKIGLNTGEVIREEEDLFGATVNATERIAGHATAGEILLSEGSKHLLGAATTVELEDRDEVELKGFLEPWRLYAVSWEEEAAGVRGAGRTPYVGREEEHAQLRLCLDQAAQGEGALVMVGGEPGVGKTRLSQELANEARERGVLALTGHCYEMEGAPPYIPFVEILESAARTVPLDVFREALGDSAPEVAKLMPELRRMFPDIPPAAELPPEQERHYLFNGVREFVERAAQTQPLLLILEDLHWSDHSTLLLLQHLAQQLHEVPVLVVGTYRDVELDVARPLAETLDGLLRQRLAQRMSLKRLPEAAVERMLSGLSGQEPPTNLVQIIHSETDGLPFFVEEVFKHLVDDRRLFDDSGRWRSDLEIGELDVPESVRLAVGRRLERVSEQTRAVLTSAALIGRVFSFDLLEALGELGPDELLDAIDEGELAHLIASDADDREERFTFAHELVRQTLISGISSSRRRRLHVRVADAIEQVYARSLEGQAADLAHHLDRAGTAASPEKTAHYSRLAAERARAMYAYEEAIPHYERALTLMGDRGEDLGQDELVLLRGLATAQRALYSATDAFRSFRRAMKVAQQRGDRQAVAELAIEQQAIHDIGFVPVDLQRELLELAVESLADSESERAAIANARLAFIALSEQHKARAQELVEKHGYREAELFLVAGESNAARLARRFDELPALTERVVKLEAEVGRTYLLAYSGWPLQVGDLGLASQLAENNLERARETHNSGAIVKEYRALLAVHYARGEFGEVERVIDLYEHEISEPDARLQSAKALLSDSKGDLEAASRDLNAGIEIAMQIQSVANASSMAIHLAAVERCRGNGQRAGAAYGKAVGWLRSGGLEGALAMQRGYHDAQLALEAAARGDSEVVTETRRQVEAERALVAVWLEISPNVIVLDRVLGVMAAAEERWKDAFEYLQRAEAFSAEKGMVVELAHCRLALADALNGRGGAGDREKAHELLTEAVAMYTKIGMPKHVEMAEAMLGEV